MKTGRDWCDAVTAMGYPGPPEMGRAKERFFPRAKHHNFGLGAWTTRVNKVLLQATHSMVFCYRSSRNLIQVCLLASASVPMLCYSLKQDWFSR
jgi:hypothetical protein